MDFRTAATHYIQNLELENGKNIPIKARQLKQELVPFFGTMPLERIGRPDVERFKLHLLGKGLAQSTVNRYLAVLSHLFNKAVEWGWLDRKPARVIKYREENVRTIYLSPDEIARLLEAASRDRCPVIEPFIRIALGTAMRRYEILSIRIEHVDLQNREIFIPHAKCGARMQPMTASLARYLETYLATKITPGNVYLFPSEDAESGHREEIEKPFRRVVQAAGLDVKQICRHTLRHTSITHLVQAGVDLPTVQRFSGHRDIQMVFRYAHQSKDHLHWALDQLDSRFSGPTRSSS
jgi:integrase